MTRLAALYNVAKFDERLMTLTAHEITHLLIDQPQSEEFNSSEHTRDPNENGLLNYPGQLYVDQDDLACLMYWTSHRRNSELETVKFFLLVQSKLLIKSNRGIT